MAGRRPGLRAVECALQVLDAHAHSERLALDGEAAVQEKLEHVAGGVPAGEDELAARYALAASAFLAQRRRICFGALTREGAKAARPAFHDDGRDGARCGALSLDVDELRAEAHLASSARMRSTICVTTVGGCQATCGKRPKRISRGVPASTSVSRM